MALGELSVYNEANRVLIAEAGDIQLLVALLRHDRTGTAAANALYNLARNNASNTVAIAAAVGLKALVQLARRGRVIVDNWLAVHGAGVPAKRKAALVVAALLRDSVPEFKSAPRDIKDIIGSYL